MRESSNHRAALKSAREQVLLEAAVLTWHGRQRLFVENYRYLLSVTDMLIVIQTGQGRVRIAGEGLLIDTYTLEEMEIKGKIREITWQQEV